VYACGKTFLWPTMLAVGSEQFPRGGAITIGAIGGVGMLSAGRLRGAGVGLQQDYFCSEALEGKGSGAVWREQDPHGNDFLGMKVQGLDGAKVGVLEDPGENGVKTVVKDLERLQKDPTAPRKEVEEQQALVDWWKGAEQTAQEDKGLVTGASLFGGRMA